MTTSRRATIFVAAALAVTALLAGCRPREGAAPRIAETRAAPTAAREAIPLDAGTLVEMLLRARSDAAAEVVDIACLLPCGRRDVEAAWVLRRGDAATKRRLIPALDIPESVRLRVLLRACGRSADRAERDPALVALARAGEIDVLPLVAAALRRETAEASFVALARAARDLGALQPVDDLVRALDRARTARALLALTSAIGPAIDVAALRLLGAAGSRGLPALELAAGTLRAPIRAATFESLGITRDGCRSLLDRCADPASAAELHRLADRGVTRFGLEQLLGGEVVLEREPVADLAPDPEPSPAPRLTGLAIAALHARAAEIIAGDQERERVAVSALDRRLRAEVPGAAASLGRIATSGAIAALASALFEGGDGAAQEISRALAKALGIGPEQTPEDPVRLRKSWEPILQTWFAMGAPEAGRAQGDIRGS